MATLFALKDRFTVLTLNECPWGFSEQAKSPCGSKSAFFRLLDPNVAHCPAFWIHKNGAFFRLISPHVANPMLILMD